MDPHIRHLSYRMKRDWQMVGPRIKRVLLATLIAFIPALLISQGISEVIEPALLRGWFRIRGPREVPQSVSIVRIDKPAYEAVRLSPGEMFPRDKLAMGITKINLAGAKAIVLDAILQRVREKKGDEKLRRALSGSPSIIGRHTEVTYNTDAMGKKKRKKHSIKPIEIFAAAAHSVVSLEVRLLDGIVEQICLSNRRDILSDENIPLLKPLRDLVSEDIKEPGGFDYINFYGGPYTLSSLSFAKLIGDKEVPEEYFKNRVVFIGISGETGSGIKAGKDTFLTSVSNEPMYGVEIHATIAANLIDGSYIRRLPRKAEALSMGVLAFLLSFAILSSGPLLAPFCAVSSAIMWFSFSYFAFSKQNYFIPGATLFLFLIPAVVFLRWGIITYRRTHWVMPTPEKIC